MRSEDMPRRSKMYEWNPAEWTIWNAIQSIEAMPADVRLSEAQTLLARAKDLVADFIDKVEHSPSLPQDPRVDAVVEHAIRPLMERIDAQERRAEELRQANEALDQQLRAQHYDRERKRLRAMFAVELLAKSGDWKNAEFMDEPLRRALDVADAVLAEVEL